MAESISSYGGSFVQYDEEKTMRLYRNIKKSLQEVQEIAAEVNSSYKNLEKNMNHAAHLITVIQRGKSTEAGATSRASVTTNE